MGHKNQTIFCIAGMHRSGSSLFANWIQNCGLYIGSELLEAASSNKFGHFEDMDFLSIHIDELKRNNLNTSGLYGNLENITISSQFHTRAKELIQQRNSYNIWGWKEPRSTLFLNEWKELIPNLKVIVLQRDRSKIVSSLYKRLKRNKWYHTRNPFKKLCWYIDIDLRPQKWNKKFNNACSSYDQAIKNFNTFHATDCLTIPINQFIHDHEAQVEKINNFLNTNLPNTELSSVFSNDLLNQ